MADIHIDDFFKDAARTLSRLYQTFPRETVLYIEDIAGPDVPDEFGMHSDRYLAALGAIVWLRAEGYVRYTDVVRQEAVDQAVLTGRTFALLTRPVPTLAEAGSADLPPAIRSAQATSINRLRNALKDGSSIAVREALMPLLAEVHLPHSHGP